MANYNPRQTERSIKKVYNIIENNPHSTANEISKRVGHSYIYTRKIIRRLVRKGRVVQHGTKVKKYHVKY